MISLQVIDQIAYIIQVAGLATVTSCMRLEINEYHLDEAASGEAGTRNGF